MNCFINLICFLLSLAVMIGFFFYLEKYQHSKQSKKLTCYFMNLSDTQVCE